MEHVWRDRLDSRELIAEMINKAPTIKPKGRTIVKKVLEPFADAILSGEKTFEIRKNEEGYQKGDIIRFEVMSSECFTNLTHPLNDKKYEITYVLSGWGLQDGYVALGIKPVGDRNEFRK